MLDQWAWYQDGAQLSEIERRIPRAAVRILDLCCGTGILSRHLALKRPQSSVIGVDISAKMVALARLKTFQLANVEIQHGDWVENIDPRVPYDCIVIKNALHLLGDIEQRMRYLRRFCHSETRIVVCETVAPNRDCLEFIKALFQILNAVQYGKRFFFAKTFHRVLDAAGLQRVETPILMRQNIDPMIWLEAKCTDPAQLALATRFVTRSAGRTAVGKRMAIELDVDGNPRRMLRLQQIETLEFKTDPEPLARTGGMNENFAKQLSLL